MRHMTKEQIAQLTAKELSAIIKSTNRYGRFAQELIWAKQEADRRIRSR